jgi:ornithine cyclodeaminase/alanine dehydrogenase-like protein (mu-crystallin family)
VDAVPWIGTDSVAQASGPGTLFEGAARRSKLRPLGTGLADGTLRDGRTTRLILNTGAAWEELAVAQTLFERAESRGAGTELALPRETAQGTVF